MCVQMAMSAVTINNAAKFSAYRRSKQDEEASLADFCFVDVSQSGNGEKRHFYFFK